MELTCSRCTRVLEYQVERPRYCAFCGSSLGDPRLEETAGYHPLAKTVAYAQDTSRSVTVPECLGGYRLIRSLGHGGMGTVFEAEDTSCGRHVALKVIGPDYVSSADAIERFRQEGRVAATLSHPRCVFVYGVDEAEGYPYIVMELMSGMTLRDVVEAQGPLAPEQAVLKILDVIEGLREAHAVGIVHRDVKPSNCFVEPDRRVKIGDFGLSRSLSTDSGLTRTGTFLGTPLYASPEQIRCDPVDVRTDVYSVSATLYFLLTGRAPFEQDDATAAMARIVSDPVPPPSTLRPGIPKALENATLKGLERDRNRRWKDLDRFRAALLPFVPGRLTLGGIGWRVVAYSTDFLIVRVMLVVVIAGILQKLGALGPRPRPGVPGPGWWWIFFADQVVWFLYLALCDGLASGTIGKRLTGLRVCVASTGGPPGLWRGLLRTAVFVGMGYSIGLGVDRLNATWPGYWLLGFREALYVVGLALLFATARARNGYRAVHELLSDTRVVRATDGERPRAARRDSRPARPTAQLSRPEELPAAVGPYEVRGALIWADLEQVLVAEDRTLERTVWITLHADRPSATARHAVNRLTRPRWLNGGVRDGQRWDAYLATPGRTLPDLVGDRRRLSWDETRAMLEDLVEELSAATADGTLPERLVPEQVWVLPDGRVQLLDFAPEPVVPPEVPQPKGDQRRCLELLRAIVALALEGSRFDPASSALFVPAPIPLHAAQIAERLLNEGGGYKDVAEVRQALENTRHEPTRITPFQHAVKLAILVALIGVVFLPVIALTAFVSFTMQLDPFDDAIQRLAENFFQQSLSVFAIIWILWAYISRGGITRRLMGIALVDSNGRPASRLRCLVREGLLWLPIALVARTDLDVILEGSSVSRMATVVSQTLPLGLLAGELVYAYFHSGRLPHDRIAGTFLVRR